MTDNKTPLSWIKKSITETAPNGTVIKRKVVEVQDVSIDKAKKIFDEVWNEGTQNKQGG